MAAIQTAALYGMVKTACFGLDKGEAILKEIDAVLREADTLQELRAELRDRISRRGGPVRIDAVPKQAVFINETGKESK